jgi:hypothetical protein
VSQQPALYIAVLKEEAHEAAPSLALFIGGLAPSDRAILSMPQLSVAI